MAAVFRLFPPAFDETLACVDVTLISVPRRQPHANTDFHGIQLGQEYHVSRLVLDVFIEKRGYYNQQNPCFL